MVIFGQAPKASGVVQAPQDNLRANLPRQSPEESCLTRLVLRSHLTISGIP